MRKLYLGTGALVGLLITSPAVAVLALADRLANLRRTGVGGLVRLLAVRWWAAAPVRDCSGRAKSAKNSRGYGDSALHSSG